MTLYMWTILAFIAAVTATTLGAVRVRRSRFRKRTYVMATAIAAYPVVVYGLALLELLHLRDIGPDLLRPWVVFALTALSMLFLTHWRD